MSSVSERVGHELESLRNDWWWFLLLGIVLVVLGIVAMGCAPFVSIFSVVFFGFLLLAAGIAQVVSAFWAGRWSGFLLHLLIGLLYVVAGYLIIDAPAEATLGLTLLLALMFMVGGIFRIVAALTLRFAGWGWPLLNGVVSLLLGLLIYKSVHNFPLSALSIIGIFIGIDLIFNGWSWVMFSVGLRTLKPANHT